MKDSLLAVLKRCRFIFPKRNLPDAHDFIKSMERILDFQSNMIGINKDVLKSLQDPIK
jgi:hypothetical protein